jgi:lipopolysaccharide heptosyltransferase II
MAMKGNKINIVVWIHHGLGDVIMVLPSLVTLDMSLKSDSRIIFIVKSGIEEKLLHLINWKSDIKIISLGHSGKWDFLNVLQFALKSRSTKPDYFIAPHASNSLLANIFARIVGAKMSVGPEGKWSTLGYSKTVPYKFDVHKVYYYSRFFETAGVYDKVNTNVQLALSENHRQHALKKLKTQSDNPVWVLISPGSNPSEPFKRWPQEQFNKLLANLLADEPNTYIGILGSPAEKTMLEEIASTAGNAERCRVFAQPDLELSFTLLEHAKCFISACTGSGHMAALVNVPVVGIYGPTNYSITGPFSKTMRIVSRQYSCSPCYRRGFISGCHDPICMTTIPVESVFAAVKSTLDGEPYPELTLIKTTNATSPSTKVIAS